MKFIFLCFVLLGLVSNKVNADVLPKTISFDQDFQNAQAKQLGEADEEAVGICYTRAEACFVAWVSGIIKNHCRYIGGGSWAQYRGVCEYPLY